MLVAVLVVLVLVLMIVLVAAPAIAEVWVESAAVVEHVTATDAAVASGAGHVTVIPTANGFENEHRLAFAVEDLFSIANN